MSASFNDLKLALVQYFIKHEGYKPSPDFDGQYSSYLVNFKKSYSIIRITIGEGLDWENILTEIKSKHKIPARQKVDVLNIELTETDNTDFEKNLISITNEEDVQTKLASIFNKIKTIKFKKEEPEEEINSEDLFEQLNDPNSDQAASLKKLSKKLNEKNPTVSLLMSVLFIFIPLALYFFTWYLQTKSNGIMMQQTDVANLVFGGINHNLAILGGQYWRILTYGFANINSGMFGLLINVVLVGFALWKLSRFTEGVMGSVKFLVGMIVSYIIVGFFMAAALPSGVYYGNIGIFASTLGMLLAMTFGQKNIVGVVSKSQMIWPTILLVIQPIATGQTNNYIFILVAFSMGVMVSYLLNYNYKKADGLLAIPIVVIAGAIIVPAIMLSIPTYDPAEDYATQGL